MTVGRHFLTTLEKPDGEGEKGVVVGEGRRSMERAFPRVAER